jgi:pyruvate/2-oxoglutarate dehydrogenase complex dihydrolipoamide acyltransferase (E2) component
MHVAMVADVTSLLGALPAVRERLPEAFRGIASEQFLAAVVAKAAARAVEECPLGDAEDEVGITDICLCIPANGDLAWHVLVDPRGSSLQQICIETLAAEADPDAETEADAPSCAFAVLNLGRFGVDDFSGVIGEDEVPVLGIGAPLESPRLRDGQWQNAVTVRVSLSATASEIRPAAAARFLGRVRQLMEHPVLLAGF